MVLNRDVSIQTLVLISDFLRIKGTGINFIKYCQNKENISILPKDRLTSDTGLSHQSLLNVKITLDFLQTKFRLSK